MIKRKKRNKIDKSKLDMTVPLDILKLGSEEDPCFGKHHDPKAEECGRCGDAEICSIVCGQKLHLKRENIEKEKKFKDIQKDETKTEKTLNQLVMDKLKSKGGKMRVIVLAKYIKESLPQYKEHDIKVVKKAVLDKFKVSSIFELYKKENKSYIKLKQK
jgi:Na+-translocating ferredoxin:NAD+ oxidoreductase RnfC subunit